MDCIIRALWLSIISLSVPCSDYVKAEYVHLIVLTITRKLY